MSVDLVVKLNVEPIGQALTECGCEGCLQRALVAQEFRIVFDGKPTKRRIIVSWCANCERTRSMFTDD